jgi:molybdate transport system ATP-binding protein
VGYVFQDGRLFQHLSVEQNLRFALQRASGRSVNGTRIGFDDAVGALDLQPLLARRPASLSGGEQQRVAIARALLTSPQLLLMDEPLSSLDVARKREILPHIESLPRRFNVPVLYVTHNVDEVVRLAGDVVLLAAGRVVANGSVTDIFERSDLLSLTGAFDAGTVLRTRLVEHRNGIATLALGSQHLRVPTGPLPVGTNLPIRIHARDVAIAMQRPQQLSIRNILAARILRVEPATSMNVELLLDVDGEHLRSRITRDALDELRLEAGQNVFALIKSVALENSLLG